MGEVEFGEPGLVGEELAPVVGERGFLVAGSAHAVEPNAWQPSGGLLGADVRQLSLREAIDAALPHGRSSAWHSNQRLRSPAHRRVEPQATWIDRIELPQLMRANPVRTLRGSSAAPRVSRSGTKWSAVGWAMAAPGPFLR